MNKVNKLTMIQNDISRHTTNKHKAQNKQTMNQQGKKCNKTNKNKQVHKKS